MAAMSPQLLQMEELVRWRKGEPVSDGGGGWKPGPPVATPKMKGMIQPLTVRDALIARQEGATVTHVMFAPWDADWRRGDEVEAVTRGFDAEVTGVRRSAKPGHHQRVSLEERQPGSTTLLKAQAIEPDEDDDDDSG